ncbi:MAG: putative D-stereospecific peptide hydrolase [Gammaproteobacteria bacterium]|nr:putative D-stereospecific peptide hydrolase [Gammaproteobacteria bacterium]
MKNLRGIKYYIPACLLLINIGLANTQQNIQNFINTWRVQNNIPAVAVSISLPKQLPQTYVSGNTTLNGNTPITANSLFGVGSITKTFVAALILQLQQEDKLSLNDKMGKWFPEYPRWKNITIRQLLNMTSGINNFGEDAEFNSLIAKDPSKVIKPSTIINLAYNHPDYFAAGAGWHYSNTNYFILGEIIEKVSHHSLAYELKHRLFMPLHLTHTYYSDTNYSPSIMAQMAHGYDKSIDETFITPSSNGPAGAMFMNVTDLLAWTQALFTPGKVLNESSIKDFMSTVPVPNQNPRPLNSGYGLGVFSSNINGLGAIWWYSGVIQGYSSVYYWIPNRKIAIAAQISGWDAKVQAQMGLPPFLLLLKLKFLLCLQY